MASLTDLQVSQAALFSNSVNLGNQVTVTGGSLDAVTITNSTLSQIPAVQSAQFTGPLTGDVIGEIGDNGNNRNAGWFTDIDASQDVSISGDLDVTGTATLADVTISNGNIDGTIIGQSVADRESIGATTIDGTTITATLGFVGNITGPGTGTTGTSTLNDLVLNGGLTMDGQSTIDASRNAKFRTLDVDEDFVPTNLTVTNDGTIGGDLTVTGDLTVNGTTTTLNTENITLEDTRIVLNAGAIGIPDPIQFGLEINRGSANPVTLVYDQAVERWTVGAQPFQASTFIGNLQGNIFNADETVIFTNGTDSVPAVFTGNVSGNASTADAWSTARSVTFATGDVTGTFSIDGSANVTNVDLTIEDNSVALGDQTTGNYAQDVDVSGNGLSITGTPGEGTQFIVSSDAVATADPQTLVFRNALGDFAARIITADTFTGNINSTAGTDNLFTTAVGDSLTVTGTATFNNSVTVSAGQTFATDTASISGGSIVRTPIGQGAGNQADIRGDTVIAETEFQGDLAGNADTASALDHNIQLSLSGDVTGTSTGNDLSGGGVTIPVSIPPDTVALGTQTTGQYARTVTVVPGRGLEITASNATDGTDYQIESNATSNPTVDSLVLRDSSGDFAAGIITADLIGDVTGTLLGNVDAQNTGTSSFRNIGATGTSTLATVAISNGTIDGTTIGNSVPADADFLDVSGNTITANTEFVGNIRAESGTSSLENLDLGGNLNLETGGEIRVNNIAVLDSSKNLRINDIQIDGDILLDTVLIGESSPGAGDGTLFEGAGGDSLVNGTLSVTDTFSANGAARFAAPQITLNYDLPGDTAPSENAGFSVTRGNLSPVSFVWNESTTRWDTFGQPLEAGDFVGSIGATTRSTGQFTTIDTSSNADIGGVLTVDATSTLTGTVTAPGGITGNITSTGTSVFSGTVNLNGATVNNAQFNLTGDLSGNVSADSGLSTFNNLQIDGNVNIVGLLTANNFELPGVTNAGTLNLTGTLSAAGNMSGDADLTIQGTADIGTDLIVRGQPRIVGKTIRLNSELGEGESPDVNGFVGITVNRGIDDDVSFFWSESETEWTTDGEDFKAANISVTGEIATTTATLASAAVSDLTSGRVVLAGTNGELEDNAGLTSTGTTLTATGAITGASLNTAGLTDTDTLDVTNDATIGGTVSAAVITTTGNVTVGSDLTVEGDLEVQGTVTQVNVEEVQLADNIIRLNSNATSGATGGLEIFRGVDGVRSFIWDETAGTEGRFSTDTADLQFGTAFGNFIGNVTVGSGQTIDVSAAAALTLADDQISGDAINGGTIGTVTVNNLTSSSATITGGEITDTPIGQTGTPALITGSTITADTQFVGDLDGNVSGNLTGNVTSTGSSTFAIAEFTDKVTFNDDIEVKPGTTVTVDDIVINGTTNLNNFQIVDLSVSGTVTFDESFITVNKGATGADTANAGIEVERGDSPNVELFWDGTNTRWSVGDFNFEAEQFIGDIVSTGTNSSFNTVDINGGTIDNTVIGASTRAAGNFTEIDADSGINGNLTGDVTGNVTGGLLAEAGDIVNVSQATLTLADDQISGDKIDGGTISNASLTGDNSSNFISGYDITVGSTRTLDVSAATLVLANDQISGDVINGGEIRNADLFSFGAGQITGYNINLTARTLDASTGTLTLANDQISGDKIDGGTISNATLIGDGTSNTITGYDITVGAAQTLTVNGGTSLSAVTVSGLSSLDGGINVDDAFTVADTSGNVVTSGTLTAAATTLTSSLDVAGLASLDGGIDVDGAFTVADTSGNVNTSGSITGNTITATSGFTGNITSSGTSVFSGTVNLNNANVINAEFDLTGDLSGNVTAGTGTSTFNDLTVDGVTTFNDNVNAVTGTTATFDDLTVDGTLTTNDFTIGGNLSVAGNSTLTGTASFESNFININSSPTGAADAGINVGRFGDSDAVLKWDAGAGQWSFSGTNVAASSFIGTLVGPVDSSNVDIDGGNIDNTPIGENTRSTGNFSTVDATGKITGSFEGPVTSTNVDIDGGDISSTTIGANGTSTGQFTTVSANTINVLTGTVTAQTIEATDTPYGFIGNLDGQINDISNWSTADLAEDPSATATSGTQYFTTTRVDAHLSGGTGVTYTNGTISIGQSVATTDDVIFNDVRVDGDITVIGAIDVPNLTVTGDLTVNGNTTTLNTETIELEDSIISLSNGYTGSSPSANAGININRGGGTEADVQFIWNESTDKWQAIGGAIVSNSGFEGNIVGDVTGNVTANSGISSFNSVDIDGGSIDGTAIGANTQSTGEFTTVTASGNIGAQTFTGNLIGNVTGTVSDLSNQTTDNLAQGTNSARQYYSDVLVEAYLSGGTGVSFSGGVISIGQSVETTDDVTFKDVTVTGTLDASSFNPTNITTTGNITVGNNLAVNGVTTLGDTVNIKANEILLNSDFSGGSPTDNVGFVVNRDSAGNVSFLWDEASNSFTVGGNTMVAGTFEGDLTGNVTAASGSSSFNSVDINGGNIDGTKIGASIADSIVGTSINGETITATTRFIGDVTGNVTGGLLAEAGDTVDVSAGTFTVAADQISGNAVDGGTISNASLAGNDSSNTISGYDITVGSTRTMDVSAGTLTLANDQISGDKIDGGTISDATLTGNGTTNSISGYDITVGAGKALTVNGGTTLSAVTVNGLATLAGGIDVDGAFTVADTSGNTAISGTLSAGATTVNGTLDVTGLASLDGGIDVDGAFTVADTSGNVSTTGSITGGVITSNSGFVGNINSNGASVFSGTVNLNGATVSNATFDLTGNLTGDVTSTGTSSFSVLNVTNLASLDGGIDVDGAFTVANATGNISTSGTLTAAATTLTSSLDVAGLASLDGGIDVDGAFSVANTSGNVNTSGSITGNTITATSGITGNITSIGTSVFSGTVDLDGATVNNAAFNLTGNLTGNVTSSGSNSFGTVTVTGLSSLDGGLNINDNLTVDAANGNTAISGTLGAGATTITATLGVSGLANLDGGIDVDGAFTVADTTGNVSTSGSLDAGNTTLSGTLSATGLASLDGGISVDGAFTVADSTGNVTTSGTVNAGDITGDTITATTEFVGDITGDVTSTGTSTFSDVNITGGSLSNVSLSLGAGSSVSAANFIGPLVGDVTSTGSSSFSGSVDLNGATVSNAAFNLTGNVTGNVTSSGASSFSDATISGGTINGVVIGGSNPGQITGSTITANNGFTGNITGDVIGNVTGDVVGNVTGTVSSLANHTTDDLANGTVNRYYADTLVDAHLSGGLGVTYTNGVIAIGQDVSTNADVTFNDVTVNGQLIYVDDLTFDNLTISGNLTVNGSTTTIDSELIELADNIILLNSNETGSPSVSAGLEIQRGTSANKQLTWNETTDKWTVGSETFVAGNFEGDVTGELTGNVTASTGTSSFNAITASGTITSNGGFDGDLTGSVTGNVTGTVSSLSNHTTDDLVEGANLYYTTARLESRIGGNLTTSIIPAQDAVYNIGSATEQFANGFFSGTVDAGTLTAQTKSFIIDHPTKPGMKLRYGSLEGPENGVYVRGKLKGTNTIEMPDYWTGLVDEDSITVTLTANRGYQQLFVADIVNNTVIVGIENKDIADIDCFYTVWAERKDVAPFQVEYTDKGEE